MIEFTLDLYLVLMLWVVMALVGVATVGIDRSRRR